MASFPSYPLQHLLGRVSYPPDTKFRPDGDTIHLRDPVLLLNGEALPPSNGKIQIWIPGSHKPRTIHLKGKPGEQYAPIRFEGIDAPEEHYRSNPFSLKVDSKTIRFLKDKKRNQSERSQPQWSPATRYAVGQLAKAGWALIELDREVTDKYGRVLGYVYASDAMGNKGAFISLELLRRGLAFPFLFESAGDFIPLFLRASASARKAGKGIWKNYRHKPVTFQDSFDAPKHYTDKEPPAQRKAPLNLPVVFRRIVDAYQLKGLGLTAALRKYDAIDYTTGDLVPGDRYHEIAIDRMIWAPHSYT
ncbi:MAG: thermonuclease family protein [Planctomycetota bacterium]